MSAVRTAVVLAAGLGSRLRGVHPDLPKSLVPIGGRPLLAWSVEALLGRGIERVVLVAGYRAELLRRFAEAYSGLDVAENEEYATTGTMASLACGLNGRDEDVLVVEGDILYDPRALDAALSHPAPNVLVASGPTGAGDEVWVERRDGLLRGLSKDRAALGSVDGELVGITRISARLGRAMLAAGEESRRADGHTRASYETDALVACLAEHPVAVELIPDLLWGEIDDASHHRRLVEMVWPALARQAGDRAQDSRSA